MVLVPTMTIIHIKKIVKQSEPVYSYKNFWIVFNRTGLGENKGFESYFVNLLILTRAQETIFAASDSESHS
jgi:hypothetical protein